MRIAWLVLACFIAIGSKAQSTNDLPKEINLVIDYILSKDYPEIFNDKSFQIRPVNWAINDIDNDGVTEVFLQTFPHYRQSPTITIYQLDKQGAVKRVKEALAPGPLIKVSAEQDFFDPHTTRTAVDMRPESIEPNKLMALAKSSLKFGMSVVLYKNFMHTDKREGTPVFLDLTHLDNYDSEASCAKFQFSLPDQIVAGKIQGKSIKYLVTRVKDELYCYEIASFNEEGLIEKTITIVKIPRDFQELLVVNEKINYLTKKGETKALMF